VKRTLPLHAKRSLIAIVDDDQSVRDSVGSLLRAAGFEIGLFESAESFLKSDDVGDVTCLILDLRMPGLSGLELQHRLNEMNASIPIIFGTADLDERARTTALGSGAAAYLYKPFTAETLFAAICRALDQRVSSALT